MEFRKRPCRKPVIQVRECPRPLAGGGDVGGQVPCGIEDLAVRVICPAVPGVLLSPATKIPRHPRNSLAAVLVVEHDPCTFLLEEVGDEAVGKSWIGEERLKLGVAQPRQPAEVIARRSGELPRTEDGLPQM